MEDTTQTMSMVIAQINTLFHSHWRAGFCISLWKFSMVGCRGNHSGGSFTVTFWDLKAPVKIQIKGEDKNKA